MGDDIKIEAKGDVAFAKDNATVTINKAIQNSGASDDLKTQLEELTKVVEEMTGKMSKEDAEDAQECLERFVGDVTKEKPKRKWYSVSGEGLIEAAKALGSLGTPVINAVERVIKLLPA